MRAGIALGANLGDRLLCLTTARQRIFTLPDAVAPHLSSALYETEPVDCEPGAAKFLNAVVEIGYTGSSRQLLEELKKIESDLGRPPQHERNRSRTIDLDLLYHGSAHSRSTAACNCPIRVCICAVLSSILWPRSGPIWSCRAERKTIREMTEALAPSAIGGAFGAGSGSVASDGGFSRTKTSRANASPR